MSKFATQLAQDIRSNPDSWQPCKGFYGISKENVQVWGYGNTKLLSVINVEIKGSDVALTYLDKWRLEREVLWWYANCNIGVLTK